MDGIFLQFKKMNGIIKYQQKERENMKKVLFYKKSNLINSVGGVEKVLVSLSNALSDKGYQIHLATRDKKKGLPFFDVSKKVVFHRFEVKFSSLRRFFGKIGLAVIPYFNREKIISDMICSYINQNEIDTIVTASVQDMADILYHKNLRQKKIVMLHSRPDVYFTKKKMKLFVNTLKKVDLVQVLLPSFVPIIKKYYKGEVVVIGNMVPLNPLMNKKEKVIIYPARIEKDKQHHLLIEAFSKISTGYPDWKIHFRGGVTDNKYFNDLKELVEKLNLQKQVFFLPPSNKIDVEYSKSSICAFPSKYEGFGLGLCEAMASGLPVIGFQYASGVSEIIQNNQNGFLVQDVSQLSEKLELLMKDDALRNQMGETAKGIVFQYGEEIILQKWEEIL